MTSGRGLLASSLFLFEESENQKQILEKALKDSLHGTKPIAHSSKTSFRWQEYLQGQRRHSTPELSQKTGSCNHYYCRLQNTDGRAHLLKLFSYSQIAHLTPADCKRLRHLPDQTPLAAVFSQSDIQCPFVSFAANIGTFILFPPGSPQLTVQEWPPLGKEFQQEAGRRERENSNPNTIFCI